MKQRHRIFALQAVGLFFSLALSAQVVSKPDVRQAALSAAEEILTIKQPSLPPEAIDPFNSAAFNEAMGLSGPSSGDEKRAGPRSDKEIITAIAAALKPSGNFIIGGQQTLIFGQKRVKAGMPMTINFEGIEYTIEITAIDRTSFTLRLNREEISRPIK